MRNDLTQITQDVVHAIVKSTPAITGTIVVRNNINIDWYAIVSCLTAVYTFLLIATTLLRNWGMWRHWFAYWKGRVVNVYGWLKSRWHGQ